MPKPERTPSTCEKVRAKAKPGGVFAVLVPVPAVLKKPCKIAGELDGTSAGPSAARAAVPGSPRATSWGSGAATRAVVPPKTVTGTEMAMVFCPMETLLTPLLLTPIVLMVTASVVGLVMLTPEGLLRADVVGLLTVTGKPLGWVAAGADIVMVSALESVAVMVVPAGMPGPVMICPTTSPETLDTDVTTLLLKVRTPVGVTTGVEVAGKDMVTVDVVAPTTVILAPVAMPVPVTACPTIRPLTLETFAMMLLPLVTMPVKEKLPDNVVVVAVAGAEIVTVLPATATMVVLAGMPAPVMVCPGSSPRTPVPPVTADTNVMRVLPRVVVPVNAKMLPGQT